jgi:Protein of unknown function (DUF3558)
MASICRLKVCAITVLLLSLAGVGCGKKDTESQPQSPAQSLETSNAPATAPPSADQKSKLPDPCTLLTKEEAEAILGGPIKDPQPNSLGGNRICEYNTQKLYGGIASYSIHIALTPESQQQWDLGKKMHAKEAHPVANLGDDAFFLLDELNVRKQGLTIDIGVMKDIDRPTHAKSVQEAEKSVAEKILPRIKT